jgi:hypothetical protein
VTARVAVKPSDSRRETSASEEFAKLLLDEAGQALSITERGRLDAEGLEMILHGVIENALTGIAWLVASTRRGHA